MKQADLGLCLRPGTDGALACAVMHVLFRDGSPTATIWPATPTARTSWKPTCRRARRNGPPPSPGCGSEIEAFARLVGRRKRSYFRLGYGFSRQRNGAVNMHAASCIAAVTGAWQLEGGGAFHNNGAIYHWRKSLIEGLDASIRRFASSTSRTSGASSPAIPWRCRAAHQ